MEFFCALETEQEILADGALQQQSFMLPVLWNNSDTERANGAGVPMSNFSAQELDFSVDPCFDFTRMQQGLQQLGLAISLDSGNSHNFAAPHHEADAGKFVSPAPDASNC